jgi:hypothetical protein
MVLKGISANQFPTLSELQHAFRDAWLDGGPRAKFAKHGRADSAAHTRSRRAPMGVARSDVRGNRPALRCDVGRGRTRRA